MLNCYSMKIQKPENKIVQAGVVVFNGKPLAAERLKQYEAVQEAGCIETIRARVNAKPKNPNEFWLHVDGEAPKLFIQRLLVDRRKDGGRPIRFLDLRRPDEHGKATFAEHPSVEVIKIDFD